MKKVLIIISTILVVLLACGAAYYFGYFSTEPETQAPPAETEPENHGIPPSEPIEGNEFKTLVFTEEEINSLVSQITTLVAEAGLPAKLEHAKVRLDKDKMLLSISGEALGMELEAKDVEICFQGTEISASGKANVSGTNISISGKARIILNDGKLAIDIETIKLGAMPIPRPTREKLNRDLNQQLAELPFPLPLQELKEITIEDGKLIITGR